LRSRQSQKVNRSEKYGKWRNAYGEKTDREGENTDQDQNEERENVTEGVAERGLSIGGRHERPD